jgi:hypothetical protein
MDQLVIDADDETLLLAHSWYLGKNGYVAGRANGRIQCLHRAIAEAVAGRSLTFVEKVDHVNGNKMDNRRCNLRVVTNRQNATNRVGVAGSSSQFKGVCYRARLDRWSAQITAHGLDYYLGCFKTEEEAAYVYDQFALELHGTYARLNLLG